MSKHNLMMRGCIICGNVNRLMITFYQTRVIALVKSVFENRNQISYLVHKYFVYSFEPDALKTDEISIKHTKNEANCTYFYLQSKKQVIKNIVSAKRFNFNALALSYIFRNIYFIYLFSIEITLSIIKINT